MGGALCQPGIMLGDCWEPNSWAQKLQPRWYHVSNISQGRCTWWWPNHDSCTGWLAPSCFLCPWLVKTRLLAPPCGHL